MRGCTYSIEHLLAFPGRQERASKEIDAAGAVLDSVTEGQHKLASGVLQLGVGDLGVVRDHDLLRNLPAEAPVAFALAVCVRRGTVVGQRD
jgi:hypothetical protein